MANNVPKLEVGLIDNACHSLLRGFEFLGKSIDGNDKLLLKEAVVWIHHGVELSLKQLLVQNNEFLVFDNIDKAVKKLGNLRRKEDDQITVLDLFDYGEEAYTVGFGKAIERAAVMLNLQELAQDEPLRKALDKLANFRNRIVHFSIDIYVDEATDMLVDLMHPFLNLLQREIKDEKFVDKCIPQIREKVNVVDYIINKRIKSLRHTESVFMERQQQRSHYVDLTRTSFENKVITFKEGFAKTEYFAHKKLLEETSRVFRDFPRIGQIRIAIPSGEEKKIYISEVEISEFEGFLDVNFSELHQDIKAWRNFLGDINKAKVEDFAQRYVTSVAL